MLETAVLASGSNGNAVHVETASARFLIDAGVSVRKIQDRLRALGKDPGELDGILITHDHLDHMSGVRSLARRFRLPVYLNQATRDAAHRFLRGLDDLEIIETGQEFQLGRTSIRTIPVPHDSADAVGYVISEDGASLGVFTDLGSSTTELERVLGQLDALVLETNHDTERLRTGHYPRLLRERISGDRGHLSNQQAAQLCQGFLTERLKFLFCAHLSAANNDPHLVLEEMSRALAGRQDLARVQLLVTSRRAASPLVRV